jgi:hypothetical protein
MLWVFGGAAALLFALVMFYLPNVFTGYFNHMVGVTHKGLNKAMGVQESVQANGATGSVPQVLPVKKQLQGEIAQPVAIPKPQSSGRRVRGYAVRGGLANVLLTDGTVATEMDSQVSRVDRISVVVNGERLFLVSTTEGARSSPALANLSEPKETVQVAVSAGGSTGGSDEGSWSYVDGVRRLKAGAMSLK